MALRFPRYGWFLLSLLLLPAGCDHVSSSATYPSALPSDSPQQSFSFEPAPLRPEVISGNPCGVTPAFGARIVVVVNGGTFVRAVRFSYTDRRGIRGVPGVTFITNSSPLTVPISSIHTGGPVPIPTGVAPIPTTPPLLLPNTSAETGLMVPPGSSQRLPFLLTFGCGLDMKGTLVVQTDATGPGGSTRGGQYSVAVGG